MQKLRLIQEHQKEYYDRRFHFVNEGFMTYKIGRTFKMEKYIYFHDMFVSKRGSFKDLYKLIKHFIKLQKVDNIEIAYCRVEKGNPMYDKLIRMYDRIGFKLIHENEDEQYYRWSNDK
jgi:hypothetical protein